MRSINEMKNEEDLQLLRYIKEEDLFMNQKMSIADYEDFYQEDFLEELVRNDEISSEEEAFMRGFNS